MKKLIFGMALACCLLAACNNKSNVTITRSDSIANYLKKIKQTALRADSAYIKKDADALVKDYAPGFTEYGDGNTKPLTNVDSIKIHIKDFFEAFPDFKGEGFQSFAEDSTVIITGMWSGSYKKEFMKMKSLSSGFNAFDADVFTFNKAGKITSHKSTFRFVNVGVKLPGM